MSSKERMKAAFSGMAYPTYEGREAIKRQQDNAKQDLLIWLCDAPLCLEGLVKLVKPYMQSGGVVHIGYTQNALEVLPVELVTKNLKGAKYYPAIDAKCLEMLLERCGTLVIPNLSQNMAAKLSVGIQDQTGLVMTWAALGIDMKVEVIAQQILKPCYGKLCYEGTKGQRELMKAHLLACKALGVVVYESLEDMSAAWREQGRFSLNALSQGKFKGESYEELKDALGLKVVTERHILALEKGSRLKIERGAKVTPLAKDAAKLRHIELVRKD